MRVRFVRAGVIALAVGWVTVASLAPPVAAASALAAPPSLTVTPHSVMVNTSAGISGRGFARHASVTVIECAVTNWLVPTDPCDRTNEVTVETNGQGRFHATFRAQICPGSATTGSGGLAFHCYLGVAAPSGLDTVALEPFAPLEVTYP